MLAQMLACLPDAICAFRALASIAVLMMGVNPLAPPIFSLALISDLFDGWIFRKYTLGSPYWHPWNPLPASCDQLADLTLVLCGVAYTGRYFLHLPWGKIGLIDLAVVLLAGLVSLAPDLVPRRSKLFYIICQTLLTHIACFMMVMSTVIVWNVNVSWWRIGAGITIVTFYTIFALIGNKKRLIRRPPPNWRLDD